MSDLDDLVDLPDLTAIQQLVLRERYFRDQGRWDDLAACYTEDSSIRTTWFHGGTGREFADQSREMAERRGRHSKHFITPMMIRVDGDRALCESYGEIHNRSVLDGVEVDMVQYCRFFSRVERTAAGWRLRTFGGIYQWDTIVPTIPGVNPVIDLEEFTALRAPYRVWAYALSRLGYEVDQATIVADDRPDLVADHYRAADAWLAGAVG